nr:pentatricopeptide repeat-containing protein At5g66520-like [Ipomoea batatas]
MLNKPALSESSRTMYMALASNSSLLINHNNNNNIAESQTFGVNRIPSTNLLLLQMCRYSAEIKQIHAQLVVSGSIQRRQNQAKLLQSYVGSFELDHASSVFESIQSPDAFAYNVMIRGLILGKRANESLVMYARMCAEGIRQDNHTYTFVLKACSRVNAICEGKQVHARIIKAGVKPNTHVSSSLIHMYSNAGCLDSAEQVFGEFCEEDRVLVMNSMITGYMNQGHVEAAREMFYMMKMKDEATWSMMIAGYTKNSMHEEGVRTFQEMVASGVSPVTESAVVSALSACGSLGALDQGRWIHRYILKMQIPVSLNLGTALVDMYARCGSIEFSYEVFKNMPRKDVVTWGVIIAGFAIHGHANRCFELLDEMICAGINPNSIIFASLLSACSYAGLVEHGFNYFHLMVNQYKITPSIEHYGCLVDLLGRAGRLAEAEELISAMPMEPNSVIWGSLLNACRIHKDQQRGERAFRELIRLDPSGDRYKLAAYLWHNNRELDEHNIWNGKDNKPGLSVIEVSGVTHEFMVRDISHKHSQDIYQMMEGSRD